VIGKATFEQLLTTNAIEPIVISGGNRFSLHASLELVAEAIAVVKQLIILVHDFTALYKRQPTEQELSTLGAQSKVAESGGLAEDFPKLVEAVLKTTR